MHPCSRILRRTADRFAPCSPRGVRSAFLSGLAGVVLLAGLLAAQPALAAGPALTGVARLDAFATSDLYPGGPTREPDTGLHLGLNPELQFKTGSHVRVKPWIAFELERYQDNPGRDLARYAFGVDLRRSRVRLRLAYGFTNDELYFPDPAGDAIVDRRFGAVDARYEIAPGLRASAGLDHETNTFDDLHPERDDSRWTTRVVLERGESRTLRTALTWMYRDTRSITDLYTYGQNVMRLDVEGALVARVHGSLRAEGAVRTYQTGNVYASNFSRQDNRWRVLTTLAHPLVGPLRAELNAQWRQTGSTRDSKDSVVRGIGLGLVYER
jgi:hypothetical protein